MANNPDIKTHTLRFRAVNRDTWTAIRTGRKRIETRAASVKYRGLKAGDRIVFVCGEDRFQKRARKVKKFRSVAALLRAYKPREINPKAKTEADLRAMYASFPAYREKLRKFGILALELE